MSKAKRLDVLRLKFSYMIIHLDSILHFKNVFCRSKHTLIIQKCGYLIERRVLPSISKED
nr:MAG TPA: hypothetical protein [Caudoviricetes sp.]